MIDIERPRWRMAIACDIAGIEDHTVVRMWRKHEGLRIGKIEAGGYRLSVLDIGELAIVRALRVLGIPVAEAIALAHGDARAELKGVLTDRLHWGFWSLGAVVVDDKTGPVTVTRGFYLEAIAERLINKLQLPLPTVQPPPRTPEIKKRMFAAIMNYFYSPPGVDRWTKWRTNVLTRGGQILFRQAAVELGAPEWFLRAVLRAEARDNLIEMVQPHVPKVVERLEGVTLQ